MHAAIYPSAPVLAQALQTSSKDKDDKGNVIINLLKWNGITENRQLSAPFATRN